MVEFVFSVEVPPSTAPDYVETSGMGFYFLSILIEITVSILIKLEMIVKALKWLQMDMDLDEVNIPLSNFYRILLIIKSY